MIDPAQDVNTSSPQVVNDAPQITDIQEPQLQNIDERLDIFNSVVNEVRNTQVSQESNTSHRSFKEGGSTGLVENKANIDLGGGVQIVEQEKNPEIPVEVESYLQRVENHVEQAPHEIIIADGTTGSNKTKYPTMPVVVLPITKKEEKQGRRKSPIYSFRWLVEWSRKIAEMFIGKVIYMKDNK